MKKSLGLLLVLLLACMFSFAACAGEGDVKIDEEHFPDPVFRKEVEQYDLDHDGIIYYKDNEIAMTQAEYDAFIWRAERKDRDALPSSFRTCQSELRVRSAVSGYDPDFKPSTKGLADLKVSASSDFSAKELDALVAEIRKLHSGPITIVDLRSETHGLLNGDHLSLYGQENWDNMGLTHEQIVENEKQIIHGLVGKEIETGGTSRGGRTTKMLVTSAETEEELCARKGVGYLRLTVLDHCFADPRSIDTFVSFVKDMPEDTWLHIHCQAGMGRTNMFLVFYDFF